MFVWLPKMEYHALRGQSSLPEFNLELEPDSQRNRPPKVIAEREATSKSSKAHASSSLLSAKSHKAARVGCVRTAPHQWGLQASLSETGREGIWFSESNAQMGHEMKPHEVCVGTENLEMLMCGFP